MDLAELIAVVDSSLTLNFESYTDVQQIELC